MTIPSVPTHERYDAFHRDFVWTVPERFNFAVDVVDANAAAQDRLALITCNAAGDVAHYTYDDMSRLTRQFGNVLRGQGVQKGDFVLIMLPRIAQWQIAMVAALRIGAVPIPCIEMLTAKDIAYRIANSGARAVICRAEQTHKLAGVEGLDVKISVGAAAGWIDFSAALAQASDACAPAQVAAEDPAVMYYTSGSTGQPKGVLHASRGLYAWWVSAGYWLALNPGDRIWCTADTGWSKAGTSILFGPWARGACSFFYDGPYDPHVRLQLLAEHRINVYCAPATELVRVAECNPQGHDLSALRQTVSAGEAVSPVIAQRWRDATGLAISEAYGQTESLMIVLNYPGEAVHPGSMGRASPGSRIEIIGGDGDILPDGEEGDIALLTPHPQLMLGYWREPERTARCFVTGSQGVWYVTGDRGSRDRDGYIWYRGRLDDIINSSGYRIGPMEVENALLEHESVAECAVVGKPDLARGEIVKAFVVLKPGVAGDETMARALQEHCKALTAPYKFPREIAFIDTIPKTMTGKIKRSELREPGFSTGASA